MIAARKISTANRAGEQHVADQGQAVRPAEEDHMARGMSGTVIDLHGFVAELNRVTFLQPPVGREGLRVAEAEALALCRQLIDPESVFGVRSVDLHAVVISERLCSAAVIQVSVREQHLVNGHMELFDCADNPLDFTARVDNGRAAGSLAHDD